MLGLFLVRTVPPLPAMVTISPQTLLFHLKHVVSNTIPSTLREIASNIFTFSVAPRKIYSNIFYFTVQSLHSKVATYFVKLPFHNDYIFQSAQTMLTFVLRTETNKLRI